MTRLTTRIAAGIGALALVGTLSACAQSPSTAATVGGQRITVADVDRTVAALPAEVKLQAPAEVHPSKVLSVKMRAAAAEQVAQARGIELRQLTEAELSDVEFIPAVEASPEARDFVFAMTEIELLQQRLGAPAVEAEFARIPVTVNPRYGLTGLENVGINGSRTAPLLRNTSLSKPAGGPQ